MIVTISGQAGSGKSTVAKILAKRLGFRHYSIGDLRRRIAEKKGITMAELNRLGESDPATDKEPDEYQKRLGEKEDNFVIDGRTSFHFIPHSFKIYLDARLEVRADRVFKSERATETFKNIEETKLALVERETSDTLRYKKYYNINCFDRKHYDLVLNTSDIPASKVVDKICKFLKNRGKI